MSDPLTVLQALDQNKYPVIALCGLAMIFNYIWFVLAVLRGFRDRVYPIPIFSTLFWLCGDGSGVLSYDLYFNVYHHWYLELFWIALIAAACTCADLAFAAPNTTPNTNIGYRCTDASGAVSFQDRPCRSDQQSRSFEYERPPPPPPEDVPPVDGAQAPAE